MLNGLPLSRSGSQAPFESMDDDNDNILVLIQLNGGNDGLNTIIPLEHYDLLANVRSNIIIPKNNILSLDNQHGLHPNLSGMKSLYDDAKMTVIKDVGYPNQNRSHFRSTDIWTSGSASNQNWTTGWLGRHLQTGAPEYPEGYPNDDVPDPFAISIGSNVSETCQGTIANFSLALADPLSLGNLATGSNEGVPDSAYGRELQFIRTTIEQTNAYGEVVKRAAEKGSNMSFNYPDTGLAEQLKSIALLISGDLRTKVYIANLGGFDTHANQVQNGNTSLGNHATLMERLGESVAAFQEDLKLLGLQEKVLTMTFSEFGRRIRSNDSLGTDHGSAAPMMVFGSCINAGILGGSSALPAAPSQSDGVPFQFDFRDVYGSVLMDWFGVEETEVRSLLHNNFSHIPFINSCQTTPTIDPFLEVNTTASPNPFDDWTTINFHSKGGYARISIYDALGHEIKVLGNRIFQSGAHGIRYNGSNLSPGNYFYRIVTDGGLSTKALVKI
ncbi:MAG: hypothetical protein ACJA01_001575 [Saprospiraceae bacterium]|jgi:uncharacterized protein (DUF1501 family)